MGHQIIRQPTGCYAIFSTETDTIIMWDATEGEVIEHFAEEAAETARRNVRRTIGHVGAGEPQRAYHQFTMTWDDALAEDRAHGGTVWAEIASARAARES